MALTHTEDRAQGFARKFAERLNKAKASDSKNDPKPKGPPAKGELGHAVRSAEALIAARKQLKGLKK